MAGSFAEVAANGAKRILTPHPGEFTRLCGNVIPFTEDRVAIARTFASTMNTRSLQAKSGRVILVLKGSETVVTDGTQVYVNTSGNPGMATAGSGDVLSGMIASLVGQRFSPLDAAKLGVYLHGRTADLALAASNIPPESLIASTLIDHICPAIRDCDGNAME